MQNPRFPEIDLPHLAAVELPPVQRVRLPQPQAEPLADLEGAVRAALDRSRRLAGLRPGARVAVAVGSRGIASLPVLVRATVGWLKDAGMRPFIVPAMGSHGGAVAEAQAALLAKLGVDEASTGAPVEATMRTVELARTVDGVPCRFDANAAAAEAVVPIARVKAHTSFDRPIESGLGKMLAVGLGKQEGAVWVHKLGPRGLVEVLPALARIALERAPVAFGIAVVENARHRIVSVDGVEPEAFLESDERLLVKAKSLMARLPFAQIDALVVERIGKEISGSGLDYAVTGRTDIRGIANPKRPFVHKLAVLGLTEATAGNGIGVGVADYIPRSCAESLDLHAMYMNVVTAAIIDKARIPVVLPNERRVLQATMATCWAMDTASARYCQIRSTLELDEALVSPSLLADIAGEPGVEVRSAPEPLAFAEDGRLLTRV